MMTNFEWVTVISLANILMALIVVAWVYYRVNPKTIVSDWIMFEDMHPNDGELVTVRLLHWIAHQDRYQYVTATHEFDPDHWDMGTYIAWREPTRSERNQYKESPYEYH